MSYSELCEIARNKSSRSTLIECAGAIADCHNTLNVGQYASTDSYAIKLWCEIDAYRARAHYLTKGKK